MEKEIIAFLQQIEELKSTLRHSWTKKGRQESSAEHTWRIAVFFLLIYDIYKPAVDPIKTVKMILIHDIPELLHGDIPAWMKHIDGAKFDHHKEREKESAKKIFGRLPTPLQKEYYDLFVEFEDGETKEAKLANALDKIESQLQHLDAGPSTWSKEERGEHMIHYPDQAVAKVNTPYMSKIWKLILDEIQRVT